MVNLKLLHDRYLYTYAAWASKTRPISKNWSPLSLVGTPDYFDRFGNFRLEEWKAYVTARDEYLRALENRPTA